MTPRTALVTGASTGMGRAIACRRAQRGGALHALGRNVHRLAGP